MSRFALAVVLGLSAGCTVCDGCRVDAVVGGNSLVSLAPSLRQARHEFFPDDPVFVTARSAARHGAAGVGGSETKGLVYHTSGSMRAGLRLSRDAAAPVGGVSVSPSVFVGAGQTAFDLPDGISVFADPATLRLDSISIVPEVTVSRDIRAQDYLVRLRAGGGVEMAYVRTTLRSALLDLSDHHRGLTPYAVAGADILPDTGRWALGVELRQVDRENWQVRGEIRLPIIGN